VVEFGDRGAAGREPLQAGGAVFEGFEFVEREPDGGIAVPCEEIEDREVDGRGGGGEVEVMGDEGREDRGVWL
jgi:hypothetical protein